MTATCQWPERNAAGVLCHTIAYVAAGTGGKAYCPHHIGKARESVTPAYPVSLR